MKRNCRIPGTVWRDLSLLVLLNMLLVYYISLFFFLFKFLVLILCVYFSVFLYIATEWDITLVRRGGSWCFSLNGKLSTVVSPQWASSPSQYWWSHMLSSGLKVMRLALKHEICTWTHHSSTLVLLIFYCRYVKTLFWNGPANILFLKWGAPFS